MDNRRTLRNLINRLTGRLRWLLRSRHMRRLDERALAIADRYGMRKEYLAARKFGLEPLSSLEDWDLILPEERALFLEPHCGLDPQSLEQIVEQNNKLSCMNS